MHEPVIVAYHTGGPYEPEAERLRASLEALGLPHQIDELPSRGSWRGNTHIRPEYLLNKIEQNIGCPLLSVDADCVFHSDPLPFLMRTQADLAVHFLCRDGLPPELLPGTMWILPTPASTEFLIRWRRENERRPYRNDRANCRTAFDSMLDCRDPIVFITADLPPEYCFISDTSRRAYPGVEPVIEHFQASRRLKEVLT